MDDRDAELASEQFSFTDQCADRRCTSMASVAHVTMVIHRTLPSAVLLSELKVIFRLPPTSRIYLVGDGSLVYPCDTTSLLHRDTPRHLTVMHYDCDAISEHPVSKLPGGLVIASAHTRSKTQESTAATSHPPAVMPVIPATAPSTASAEGFNPADTGITVSAPGDSHASSRLNVGVATAFGPLMSIVSAGWPLYPDGETRYSIPCSLDWPTRGDLGWIVRNNGSREIQGVRYRNFRCLGLYECHHSNCQVTASPVAVPGSGYKPSLLTCPVDNSALHHHPCTAHFRIIHYPALHFILEHHGHHNHRKPYQSKPSAAAKAAFHSLVQLNPEATPQQLAVGHATRPPVSSIHPAFENLDRVSYHRRQAIKPTAGGSASGNSVSDLMALLAEPALCDAIECDLDNRHGHVTICFPWQKALLREVQCALNSDSLEGFVKEADIARPLLITSAYILPLKRMIPLRVSILMGTSILHFRQHYDRLFRDIGCGLSDEPNKARRLKWGGVTVDFSDAQRIAITESLREQIRVDNRDLSDEQIQQATDDAIRGCSVHFKRNLRKVSLRLPLLQRKAFKKAGRSILSATPETLHEVTATLLQDYPDARSFFSWYLHPDRLNLLCSTRPTLTSQWHSLPDTNNAAESMCSWFRGATTKDRLPLCDAIRHCVRVLEQKRGELQLGLLGVKTRYGQKSPRRSRKKKHRQPENYVNDGEATVKPITATQTRELLASLPQAPQVSDAVLATEVQRSHAGDTSTREKARGDEPLAPGPLTSPTTADSTDSPTQTLDPKPDRPANLGFTVIPVRRSTLPVEGMLGRARLPESDKYPFDEEAGLQLWPWRNNSCAVDAYMAALLAAMQFFPEWLQFCDTRLSEMQAVLSPRITQTLSAVWSVHRLQSWNAVHQEELEESAHVVRSLVYEGPWPPVSKQTGKHSSVKTTSVDVGKGSTQQIPLQPVGVVRQGQQIDPSAVHVNLVHKHVPDYAKLLQSGIFELISIRHSICPLHGHSESVSRLPAIELAKRPEPDVGASLDFYVNDLDAEEEIKPCLRPMGGGELCAERATKYTRVVSVPAVVFGSTERWPEDDEERKWLAFHKRNLPETAKSATTDPGPSGSASKVASSEFDSSRSPRASAEDDDVIFKAALKEISELRKTWVHSPALRDTEIDVGSPGRSEAYRLVAVFHSDAGHTHYRGEYVFCDETTLPSATGGIFDYDSIAGVQVPTQLKSLRPSRTYRPLLLGLVKRSLSRRLTGISKSVCGGMWVAESFRAVPEPDRVGWLFGQDVSLLMTIPGRSEPVEVAHAKLSWLDYAGTLCGVRVVRLTSDEHGLLTVPIETASSRSGSTRLSRLSQYVGLHLHWERRMLRPLSKDSGINSSQTATPIPTQPYTAAHKDTPRGIQTAKRVFHSVHIVSVTESKIRLKCAYRMEEPTQTDMSQSKKRLSLAHIQPVVSSKHRKVDDSEHKLVSVADTLANTCHCKRQCSARCPCQVSPLGCSVRCHDPEFKCRKRRRDDEEVAVLMLSSLAETGARDDTATLRASSQLSNPKRAKRTRP